MLPMSISSAFSDPEDPHIVASIARAEHRRGKLERMSDIGMELVEQIGAHAAAAMAAADEARGGDPARAFATLARSVRMTLALEAQFDDEILAIRRGEFAALRRARGPAAEASAPVSAPTIPVAPAPDPRRDRIDEAVREVVHLEAQSITEARERLDALNERLFDTESYDVLLKLPLRDAVAAVCADLGSSRTGACGPTTNVSSPRPAAAASIGRNSAPRAFRPPSPAPSPRRRIGGSE